MNVTPVPTDIVTILKDKIFEIPAYQREYSWSREQVSDLFYDIQEADSTGHYIGALLFFKKSNGIATEIVDGQQRITTFFLLISSILEKLKGTDLEKAKTELTSLLFKTKPNDLSDNIDKSTLRLTLGKRDKVLFEKIIRRAKLENYSDRRRKSHKGLLAAIDFFDDVISNIVNRKGHDGLKEFAEKVIGSKFIVMTATQQSDKLLLFKTINARGVELTQGDLIKNELCSNVKECDAYDLIEQWNEMRTNIENASGKFDLFLFHYINSLDSAQMLRQTLDEKRGKKNWSKKNYPPVSEKLVFDVYCQLLGRDGADKLMDGLYVSCKKYITFLNPCSSMKSLKGLKAMAITKCFPLLLNASRKLDDNGFELLAKNINALSFRHSILRNDPKELEKFFYMTADELTNKDMLPACIEAISSHPNFKNDDAFKREFTTASPKSAVSKMILDRVASTHGESVDWAAKDVHIEHIMPQKPTHSGSQWEELFAQDNEKYKDFLNRLGNLTILQDKLNYKARNHDFTKKKKWYGDSRLKITQSLTEHPTWSYESINERQEWLYEQSKSIWESTSS